jgi:hypothetical protein
MLQIAEAIFSAFWAILEDSGSQNNIGPQKMRTNDATTRSYRERIGEKEFPKQCVHYLCIQNFTVFLSFLLATYGI